MPPSSTNSGGTRSFSNLGRERPASPSGSDRVLSRSPSNSSLTNLQSQQSQPPRKSDVSVSPVGSLCARMPKYVRKPPIEAVVFAWGVTEDAQTGHEPGQDIMTPKVVDTLLGVQFAGRSFSRVPLIAGSRNTLGLDADGQVWSWGWNERGTLGHGHRGPERKPKRVQALTGTHIVQMALGGWHALALSRQGQVFAWGGNEYLQCGVEPDKRDMLVPVLVTPLLGLRIRSVACGGMHSLALTDTGTVWTWGEPWGEFALAVQRQPRQVQGAVDIAAVVCGAFHNMALTKSGAVLTWGTNDYGQLGNGNTSYQTRPTRVSCELDNVKVADIAAAGWHSLAISSSGELYTWGRGEYGRLGLGDRSGSSKLRPQKVKGLEGHIIVQASAGGTHSVVLTSTGRVFIWGRASLGRLGLSSDKDCYSPVEVALPGGYDRWRVAAVAAGGRHTMCLAIPLRASAGAVATQQTGIVDEEFADDGEDDHDDDESLVSGFGGGGAGSVGGGGGGGAGSVGGGGGAGSVGNGGSAGASVGPSGGGGGGLSAQSSNSRLGRGDAGGGEGVVSNGASGASGGVAAAGGHEADNDQESGGVSEDGVDGEADDLDGASEPSLYDKSASSPGITFPLVPSPVPLPGHSHVTPDARVPPPADPIIARRRSIEPPRDTMDSALDELDVVEPSAAQLAVLPQDALPQRAASGFVATLDHNNGADNETSTSNATSTAIATAAVAAAASAGGSSSPAPHSPTAAAAPSPPPPPPPAYAGVEDASGMLLHAGLGVDTWTGGGLRVGGGAGVPYNASAGGTAAIPISGAGEAGATKGRHDFRHQHSASAQDLVDGASEEDDLMEDEVEGDSDEEVILMDHSRSSARPISPHPLSPRSRVSSRVASPLSMSPALTRGASHKFIG